MCIYFILITIIIHLSGLKSIIFFCIIQVPTFKHLALLITNWKIQYFIFDQISILIIGIENIFIYFILFQSSIIL